MPSCNTTRYWRRHSYKISSNYYDNISFQSSTLGSKSRKLQITKSGLSVFIHLKYTALEKLIEDRNISRDFITNSVGRWPCQSRRPTWKFYIFAPKSSQTMSPQIKLYLLYYFPIMHFDASTKFQIWWCTFFAEVPKTTLAGCIEHLGGFVS